MTSTKEWPSDGGPHTSDSIGQALAGLVARDSAGNPIEGMIAPPTITAVGGAWKVEVSRFVYVRNDAGSARLSPLSAAEQHDIANAASIPAGQARIDRVCWNPVTGELVVLPGTPGTSPVAPGAGVLASVATVRVNAGDGMVLPGQVSRSFALTSLAPSAGDRQYGTVSHPGGGAVLSGSIFRSATNPTVTFPEPFDEIPNLQVTGHAGGSSVAQWASVVSVTRTGFTFRVLSVNLAPTAGTVTWEAWD